MACAKVLRSSRFSSTRRLKGPLPMSHARPRILALDTYDIRFPTSREHDGSDAMNPDPDYSAAYVVLRSDALGPAGQELAGPGFAFPVGRGNEVQGAAIEALPAHVVGRELDELCADPGSVSRALI